MGYDILKKFIKVSPYPTKKESFGISLIWLFLIARLTWPKGIETSIGNLAIASSSNSFQVKSAFGLGDAGNLLDVALTWSNFRSLSPTDQFWIVRLWSPGLPILEVPMLWLEGLGIPLFWTFTIFLVLLWTIGFFLAWHYLTPLVGRLPLTLFASVLVFSWDFEFLFHEGIFYTEGFSYIFLLYSLFQISYILIAKKVRFESFLVALSGVCLGISIWIRHTLDSYIFMIALIAIAFFILEKNINFFEKTLPKVSQTIVNILNSNLHRILIKYAAIAFVVTLPWRIIATYYFQGAKFQMSSGGGLFGTRIWADPESEIGRYWDSYGVNWACKIDTSTCADLQDKLNGTVSPIYLIMRGLQAAIENPIAYLHVRWTYMMRNWVPDFGNSSSVHNILGLIGLVLLFVVLILVFLPKSRKNISVFIIWLPIILLQLIQFMIIHFEPRYFISTRITVIGLLLFLVAGNQRPVTKRIGKFYEVLKTRIKSNRNST